MRILIAPDKFKESLGAKEVAQNIAVGLREVLPDAEIELVPMADGGEGTAEVICQARGGDWVTCEAHDAIGRAIEARYVWLQQSQTAVIDMSEAAGIWRLASAERDPLRASTFGAGEMLRDAISRGATEIIVGLGGSATNDGGWGMVRALGFSFLRDDGSEIASVAELIALDRIEKSEAIEMPTIVAASDVRNPLLGERGATRVFGRQKGASFEQIALLERALAQLADIAGRDLRCDLLATPGAGAGGGLGFGLMAFCRASMRSGFDIVAEAVGLRRKIAAADVVITGEGRLDEQTREGKAPAKVARLARTLNKPVFAIVGSSALPACEFFDGIFKLAEPPITSEQAMARAPELLRARARELAYRLRTRAPSH